MASPTSHGSCRPILRGPRRPAPHTWRSFNLACARSGRGRSAMADYNVLPAGDTALVVDFGNRVDLKLSAKVLALGRRLDELHLDGIIETVPTARSLSVYYEPLSISAAALQEHIVDILEHLPEAAVTGRRWQIPVCYDSELAPDLGDVAQRCNVSTSQVIELHSSVAYHVYMLGFLPGL